MRLTPRLPVTALLLTSMLAGCSSAPEVIPDSTAVRKNATLVPPKLPPVPAGAKRINGIAAIVNDDLITFHDLIRESEPVIRDAERRGLLDDSGRRKLRVSVLDKMIDKLLTTQKVKELGIRIGDDEVRQAIDDVRKQNNMTQSQLEMALRGQGISFSQYEAQIREQLERLRLVSMEVRSKVNVTDKDAQEYYNSHQQEFAEEETFHARHIFVKVDKNGSPEQIRNSMQKALNLLYEARSGKDFAELAREQSDDPAAKKDGGDLGTFKKGEMLADLEQAILPLKPGEVGELVSTPAGLHIVKLEDRSSGKVKPFETVKDEIREKLYRQRQDERFSSWLTELRNRASIILKDGSGII